MSRPVFQSYWEAEYKITTFNPREMSLVCLISAVFFLGHFAGTVGIRRTDDVGGSYTWLLFTWMPELVCGLQNALWLLVLNAPLFRGFCVKRYDVICTYIIISSYITTILPQFVWEVRLSEKDSIRYNDTRLTIDYETFPPKRTCTQRSSLESGEMLLAKNYRECQEAILSGTNFVLYLFWNLMPRICRIRVAHALFVTTWTFAVLLLLTLSAGIGPWFIAFCATFQLATGLATASVCMGGDQRSRDKFAMSKSVQFAAEQNRALLYTLIPQNVVQRLSSHSSTQMLGCDISQCTVLFAALETHVPLQLLDSIYSAFDAAVQRLGMFKYQHVGDWFIVACPRVAKPFDEEEQRGEYKSEYVTAMVELAFEMIAITPFYGARTRVGIAHGPAAGAVIGTLRAFYCLYGDTVNTAARMCKSAPAGRVHCTEQFAALVTETTCPGVTTHDRGTKEIKGKGLMRLIELNNQKERKELAIIPTSPPTRISATGSNQEAVLAVPDSHTLAIETQNAWLKDPARKITPPLYKFADLSLEGVFGTVSGPSQVRLLSLGMVLNAMATALEWRMSNMSDQMLTVHFAVTCCVCAAMLAMLWGGCLTRQVCSLVFAAQLIVHLCIASAVARTIEQTHVHWSWVLVFATGSCIITGWMGQPSVRNAAILGIAAVVAFFYALSAQPLIAPRATDTALILSLTIGMIGLSFASNYGRRSRFLVRRFYEAQLEQLRTLLHDLLPPTVAAAMINISGRPAPEKCTAAMLQLDICGFTDLSQTITPMQLAMLMHKLFTYFDDTVQANGLFKMDTVGDAYIVAALLPDGETQRRCACLGLLEVAKTMIEGMRKHHHETGQQLHCRIGAATGEVTTGVLGHLQTRFHITGPGLQAAETMEQTSPLKDSLHAAPSFIDMLRAPNGALELPGWTIIPPPEEGPVLGTSLVPVDEAEHFSSVVLSPPVLVFRGSA